MNYSYYHHPNHNPPNVITKLIAILNTPSTICFQKTDLQLIISINIMNPFLFNQILEDFDAYKIILVNDLLDSPLIMIQLLLE